MDTVKPLVATGIPAASLSALSLLGALRRGNGAQLVPKRTACGIYAIAYGVGALAIVDGDPYSGAIIVSTWGAIYSWSHRKDILRGPVFARVLLLAGVAGAISHAAVAGKMSNIEVGKTIESKVEEVTSESPRPGA